MGPSRIFYYACSGVGEVNRNNIAIRCVKGSLGAILGEVVGSVVALDACVQLDFNDMYWVSMRLYLSKDVMWEKK